MSKGRLPLFIAVVLSSLIGCQRQAPGPEHATVFDFARHLTLAAVTRPTGRDPQGGPIEPPGAPIPRFDAERRALLVPFGTRLDYFVRLPAAAWIAVEEVSTRDLRSALTITLQRDGEDERVLTEIVGPSGPQRLPLPEDDWPITRVSISARAQSESYAQTEGIALMRPRIEARLPRDGEAGRRAAAGDRVARNANVIIYLSDALRADHLGCYGYERPTSPRIDEFASGGLLFESAMAQSPWTSSALSSLFTGVYPMTHRVTSAQRSLPGKLVTMAELLHRSGYATAGVITNGAAGSAFGLDRGFIDHRNLRADPDQESVHQLSDRVNEEVVRWLDQRDEGRPFFLYVHTTDVHSPYTPPLEFARKFIPGATAEDRAMPKGMPFEADPDDPPQRASIERLVALYDAEIAFNDHHFGRFLEELRSRGLYDQSLIIFLSDHGEEFYEHGHWQHLSALYTESLAIPLILKPPRGSGVPPGRTAVLAQQVDLLPTVLSLLGLAIPAQVEGRDLLAAVQRGGRGRPASGFAHFEHRDRWGASVVDGEWKLLRLGTKGGEAPELRLFNLELDPAERNDVSAAHPIVIGYLSSLLRARESGGGELQAGESEIDQELRRELEALGYLD